MIDGRNKKREKKKEKLLEMILSQDKSFVSLCGTDAMVSTLEHKTITQKKTSYHMTESQKEK